jgi:hypothetical protein
VYHGSLSRVASGDAHCVNISLQCIVDHFLQLFLVMLTTNTSLVTCLQCIVDQTISAPDVHC